jgi:cytidine deaminase
MHQPFGSPAGEILATKEVTAGPQSSDKLKFCTVAKKEWSPCGMTVQVIDPNYGPHKWKTFQ